MRTYGRTTDEFGVKTWHVVETDANGSNDYVYLTTLAQVLQLSPNESPFHSDYGIPAVPSVISQILPDYYMNMTQQQFAGYFASLVINRITPNGAVNPVYDINVVTNSGTIFQAQVAT